MMRELLDARENLLQSFSDNELMDELVRRDASAHLYLEKAGFPAWKLWSRENIESILESKGYATTDENVDEVINTGMLSRLEEFNDGDWDIIKFAVHECSERLQVAEDEEDGEEEGENDA